MKKTALFILVFFCAAGLFAQKGKVRRANSYYKSGKLDVAKSSIDDALNNEDCQKWEKTFYVKGLIYQGIFESPLAQFKNLSKDPLNIAWDAYQKLIEMDRKGRYKDELITQYKNLIIDFTNDGVDGYNTSNFEKAYKSFARVIEIRNSDILKGSPDAIVDTAIIFNAALSAQRAKLYPEAEKFYRKALEYNYDPAKTYSMLYSVIKDQGKKEEALLLLQKGYELYPDNSFLLIELINHYLLGGEPEKAEGYLDAAIKQDPNNASFYRAKGTLYEKTKQLDKAQEMYKKTLEIDPKDFYAQYGIANFMLTKVVELHNKVNSIENAKKYNDAMKKVYEGYKEAIPYFEKARELNPKDEATLTTLRELYFKLRVKFPEYEKKYKEVDATLKSL